MTTTHLMDSVRRFMVARAVTPTILHPLSLLLEPGGRIVVANQTAHRLVGRDDVAWIFWDRVLASADDAHRVRETIRAAFKSRGESQTCEARMHGSGTCSFTCTAVADDHALLVGHGSDDSDQLEDLSGEPLYDRTTLDRVEKDESLLDLVSVEHRTNLLRALVMVDGEMHAGPFQGPPGTAAFFLSLRETTHAQRPALAARVVA